MRDRKRRKTEAGLSVFRSAFVLGEIGRWFELSQTERIIARFRWRYK